MARLIAACAETAPDLDLVVRLHDGDPFMEEYDALPWPCHWRIVKGPHQKCPGALQHMFRMFPHEKYYGFVADDVVPGPKGWNLALQVKAGTWNIAYPDDGQHGERLCTHFCIGGKLVRNVGFLGAPFLDHNFMDNVWYAIGHGLGLLQYCPEVKFTHLHPLFGTAETDDVYKLGNEKYQQDKKAFENWGKNSFDKLMRKLAKKVPIRGEKEYQVEEKIHVAICIPSGAEWSAEFGLSLATMCSHFYQYRVGDAKGQKLSLLNTRGSMLSENRQSLLRNAFEKLEGVTHVLWLDDDMKFPPDTLHRLLLAGKDFVAAQGVTKQIPAEPVAQSLDGTRCYSDPHKKGLEEVHHVGLAVALLRLTEGVRQMKPPHFNMEWIEGKNAYAGEDVFFCHRLRDELGMKLFVDHSLSRQVGHYGSLEYTHQLVGEIKEEAS